MFRIEFRNAVFAAAALVGGIPLALLASANGPVPARTGGFGEMTCHQCHSNNPLNDPSGQLAFSGVPATYTLGQQYLITVAMVHPRLVRAGFQLSARFATGEETGRNAGAFRPADDLTEAVPDDGGRITYIQHTAMGASVPMPGSGRWTFQWIAPASAAPIAFHLAANAANGDGLSRDDFVYTATAASQPAAPAP
ncbi:MAG: choice-of-anchor V domain-containing protein [Vicinamibacterales bacterium]